MKLAEDLRRSVLQAAVEGKLTGGSREGWRFVRLDEIVAKRIKRGKSPKYAPHSNTLVFAQKCNTKRGNIDLSLALYLDESTIGKYPEEEFIIDGDIVLNSTGRGTLGRVGQYRITDNPQNIPLVPDSHVTIIRPKQNISSEYICYILKNYQPYIETLGEGSTKQTELSAKKIAGLIIPLPPIDEQRRIVSRLDAILHLIAELESAENELEALERRFPGDMRDSLLQAAIERRLTGSNTDNWRYVRLGEIIIKYIGGGTPDKSNPEYWNGNIPWMSVKDFAGVKDGFIEDTIDHISEQGLENSATNLIMPGAIIMCMRMGLGKYARLKKPTAINQDLRAIWLSEDVLADYFLYFYSTLKIEGTGTTVKGIKRNELLSYIIPLSPIDEQHKIVARLNELLPLCEAMKGE
ncbi:MAG: restriction endonuclease subunit S [Synergistaceae bacterium]|nr:restriction endonuclease subunit S [Synergistaceae bacterium]